MGVHKWLVCLTRGDILFLLFEFMTVLRGFCLKGLAFCRVEVFWCDVADTTGVGGGRYLSVRLIVGGVG